MMHVRPPRPTEDHEIEGHIVTVEAHERVIKVVCKCGWSMVRGGHGYRWRCPNCPETFYPLLKQRGLRH